MTSIIFVATKVCLSRQNYVCLDKHVFVMTKLLSQQIVVPTNILSRQTRIFVIKHVFCRDKIMQVLFLVTPKVLLRQTRVCRDKYTFVTTKPDTCLCRQKLYLWQLPLLIVFTLLGPTTVDGFQANVMSEQLLTSRKFLIPCLLFLVPLQWTVSRTT